VGVSITGEKIDAELSKLISINLRAVTPMTFKTRYLSYSINTIWSIRRYQTKSRNNRIIRPKRLNLKKFPSLYLLR
jgi:hypothetical protein